MVDKISIKGLSFDCVIGLYPDERRRQQTLEVDVVLNLDLRKAAYQGMKHSLDYNALSGEVRFIMEHGKFQMLETAAEALSAYILHPYRHIQRRPLPSSATVTLKKPQALGHSAVPAIKITRSSQDYSESNELSHPPVSPQKKFGIRDQLIFQHNDCQLLLRHYSECDYFEVSPKNKGLGTGSVIGELALTSGLLWQGQAWAAGHALLGDSTDFSQPAGDLSGGDPTRHVSLKNYDQAVTLVIRRVMRSSSPSNPSATQFSSQNKAVDDGRTPTLTQWQVYFP